MVTKMVYVWIDDNDNFKCWLSFKMLVTYDAINKLVKFVHIILETYFKLEVQAFVFLARIK